MKRKSPPHRGFPTSEYEQRLERAQELMYEHDIAALFLTTEPEIRYFSGFLSPLWQSPTRPWFLVVPLNNKPIAIIPQIGVKLMSGTWIEDVFSWSEFSKEKDSVSLLKSVLLQTSGRSARIGILMGQETHLHMPLGDFFQLRDGLLGAGCELVDATPLIRSLRLIKSAAEIEKIAYICNLVSDAFLALPNQILRGDTERDIHRKFKVDVINRGADDVPYLVGGAGPDGYSDIISPPSDVVIKKGDLFMLDTGSVLDGYYCDFDRNYAFGRPSDAVRRAYSLLYRATEAGMKAARKGITVAAVFRSMALELEEFGSFSNFAGRMGHGLGMQLTEWPSITPTDTTHLQPGMVVTLEPWLEIKPGQLMVHEENIVIGESGAELLTTRAPLELPIIT